MQYLLLQVTAKRCQIYKKSSSCRGNYLPQCWRRVIEETESFAEDNLTLVQLWAEQSPIWISSAKKTTRALSKVRRIIMSRSGGCRTTADCLSYPQDVVVYEPCRFEPTQSVRWGDSSSQFVK